MTLSTGVIIGISLGIGIFVMIMLGLTCFYCIKLKESRQFKGQYNPKQEESKDRNAKAKLATIILPPSPEKLI